MTAAMARACAAVALATGIAACGGSDRSDVRTPGVRRATPTPSASATPSPAAAARPATAAQLRVIRGWADALRGGHVKEAAGWFAVPSIVSNGTPPIRLTSREDVRSFNRTLTCGAQITATERRGRYVIATFMLTERPGSGTCGSGVGATARTAFRIRRGRIAEWVRLPDADPDEDPAPEI